jgi:hypothetical protein
VENIDDLHPAALVPIGDDVAIDDENAPETAPLVATEPRLIGEKSGAALDRRDDPPGCGRISLGAPAVDRSEVRERASRKPDVRARAVRALVILVGVVVGTYNGSEPVVTGHAPSLVDRWLSIDHEA